jgi:hypothetical protein
MSVQEYAAKGIRVNAVALEILDAGLTRKVFDGGSDAVLEIFGVGAGRRIRHCRSRSRMLLFFSVPANLIKWGIYVTQVTTTSSIHGKVLGDGRRLPSKYVRSSRRGSTAKRLVGSICSGCAGRKDFDPRGAELIRRGRFV